METPIVPSHIRKIFDGRVFRVQVETITLPLGHQLDAEIVRHPGSVVLVPVTDAGELILVRQYRHAIGRSTWELPAGSLKPGEVPAAAAARECQEETGFVPDRLESIGAFFPTPGYCDEQMHFYVAAGLRDPDNRDQSAQRDEDEDLDVGSFSIEAVQGMIARGDIIDLKTVAGLALIGLARHADAQG